MAPSVSHAGTLLSFAAQIATQQAATLRHQCAAPQVFSMPDPPPSIPQAWEAFVEVLEREGFIGNDECFACGGVRGASGLLEHGARCAFDALDVAVLRDGYRTNEASR